jgi:hypothetical protein
MTLEQLYTNLKDAGISDSRFYLHGLYGSTDDDEKLALAIKGNSNGKIIYEIYTKERGVSSTLNMFYSESEACKYFLDKMIYERDMMMISRIEGLEGMTVNERLYASGLMKEFDSAIVNDKVRAREILKLLRVDRASIDRIVS